MPQDDTPRFDAEFVTRLAHLARLALDPEEADEIAQGLARIVGYVDMLGELELGDVPPTTSSLGDASALRADVPRESLPHEVALSQAPRSLDGGFAVPAFVDEG
jgi:aspartyl-tRNA(Asn)/glutamyl-tRNA(Gln) amidotransferase subunit C